jgi:hypothetical protein
MTYALDSPFKILPQVFVKVLGDLGSLAMDSVIAVSSVSEVQNLLDWKGNPAAMCQIEAFGAQPSGSMFIAMKAYAQVDLAMWRKVIGERMAGNSASAVRIYLAVVKEVKQLIQILISIHFSPNLI